MIGALLLAAACAPSLAGRENAAAVVLRVRDGAGAPVADAPLELASGAWSVCAVTDADGCAAVARPGPVEPLRVRVRGETEVVALAGNADGAPVDVRLEASGGSVAEAVTVSASLRPERVAESAASVVEVRAEDFAVYPGAPPDVALRDVPGFSLFRRSDSRSANPTAQGVSLRGVGGSGASRAAVLDDGVPLNDPFGGWVAWGRVPPVALDRAEVVRGGASSLYGGSALAGAIQLVRRDPDAPEADAETSYGSFGTLEGAAFAGGRIGGWRASVSAEGFRTDGEIAVAPDVAGAVDTPLAAHHASGEARVERDLGSSAVVFASGALYRDSRDNGTPLQVNDTRLDDVRAGGAAPLAGGDASVRLYGTWERYSQSFSAIAADRDSERLTSLQEVPSRALGGTGRWSAVFGAHAVAAGIEGREVIGESDETLFPFGGGTTYAAAGGRQLTGAVFVEDRIAAGKRTTVLVGGRYDSWRNDDAFRESGPTPSDAARQDLPSRSESFFSPRLSLSYRAGAETTLVATAYRAFRAPTLNELYRGFRVGNVVTLPNADLSAERLTGGELGIVWTPPGGRVLARGTLYWMDIADPVTSVTLSTTPSVITRQRQNLGRTRTRGAEVDVEAPVAMGVTVAAGYAFADATVVEAADPTLVGLAVPQVPRHQATLRVRGAVGPVTLAAVARYVSEQFDDDRNQLPLAAFATLDLMASVPVAGGLQAFIACENATDERYEVGRTPVATLAPGRAVRGGVRIRLGRR
ncbi:MAG TPA: TonB-dependent receptor [Thermoanaerobaculia bacterium]|nr:TonB-dependent receptor [Thermoanaerobaculia bacterium]